MSLTDILSRRSSEVTAPQPLPQGTYLCSVTSIGKIAEIGQNKTNAVNFELTIINAGEDVDPVELAALDKSVVGRKIQARFFLTEEALYRLTEFFEKLGLPEDITISEGISSAQNHQVYVKVKHRTYTDSENNVKVGYDIAGYIRV